MNLLENIDSIKCICNNKLLKHIADIINEQCTTISLNEVQTNYSCCKGCGLCIPYLKQLIKIPNDLNTKKPT